MRTQSSLTCLSGSEHDELLLKSLLNIMGHRPRTEWIYQEQLTAPVDVLIVDCDGNRSSLQEIRSHHKTRHIVAYTASTPPAGFDDSLHKPLRAKDLLALLERIEPALVSINPGPNITTPDQPAAPATTKSSLKLLDDIIHIAIEHKSGMILVDLQGETAIIDCVKRKALTTPEFFRSAFIPGMMHSVRWAEQAAPHPAGLRVMSLTDFFYDLTVKQPPAKLAKGLDEDAEFHIRQWPALSNSANSKAMIQAAAYFSKHKSTLRKAAADLSMSINELTGFINAVHGQNLLVYSLANNNNYAASSAPPAPVPEQVVAAPVEKPASGGGLGGLFGRIRKKLGL